MSKKRTLDEIRQTKDSIYRAPRSHELIVDTTSKEIPEGWWLQISPLARINPEEWIVGVLRKGKASWITEMSKGEFNNPQDAYDWGIKWIDEYREKKGI